MKNIKIVFQRGISLFFIFVAFILFCWLIIWEILAGYISIIFLLGAVIWGAWKSFRKLFYSCLILFLVNFLLIQFSINQYTDKSDDYFKRIQNGQSLSISEKVSIFGLNLFFCVGGYLIYPEIAKESFLMMFKDADRKREFETDFFLSSVKIKQKFCLNSRKRVISSLSWTKDDYVLGQHESRIALALNPCYVHPQIAKGNYFEYRITNMADYPMDSKITLIDVGPIHLTVQEGLFNYLETIGWLHPYEATWKAKRTVSICN